MTRKTITNGDSVTTIELGYDVAQYLALIARGQFPDLPATIRHALGYLGLVRFNQVGVTGGAVIPRVTKKGRAWLRAKAQPDRLDTSRDGLKPPVKTAPAGPKSLDDVLKNL